MASPKTSVIAHPPENLYLMIRQDYKVICCGNSCAAALLAVLENWANSKGKDEWIYRSQEELSKDMLYEYSSKTIGKCLDELVEWGYIERRNNPNRGYDRKYQYRLLVANIHFAIRNFFPMEAEEVPNANGKSSAAIQQNQKRIKKDSPADAGRPAKKPRTAKQLESDRIQAISAVMATYHAKWRFDWRTADDWTDDFHRSVGIWRGEASKGSAGQVAKLFPELTPDLFEAFLRDYEKTCEGCTMLARADAIKQRLDDWLRERTPDDTRTPDEIRAALTPLQKAYADKNPDESLRRIEAMTETTILALRPELAQAVNA